MPRWMSCHRLEETPARLPLEGFSRKLPISQVSRPAVVDLRCLIGLHRALVAIELLRWRYRLPQLVYMLGTDRSCRTSSFVLGIADSSSLHWAFRSWR